MARMTSDCLPHQVERTKTLFGYFVDNGSQHQFKVGGRPATLGLCAPALHASAHHSASLCVSCATPMQGRRPPRHHYHFTRAVARLQLRTRPPPTTAPNDRREPVMPTTAPPHGGAIPQRSAVKIRFLVNPTQIRDADDRLGS
jgi:hypothetical protein